jgi:hypothetical protein
MSNAVFRTVLWIRIRITLRRPDADSHQSEKQDPNPQKVKRKILIRIKVKIQKLWKLKIEPRRAVDARNGGSKWSRTIGSVDPMMADCHTVSLKRIRFRIRTNVKS